MNAFDELLSDLETPETAEVRLQGRTREWAFRIRLPKRLYEWQRLITLAENCVVRCREAAPPEYEPYLPVSPEEARLAYLLHALCIEPELTELQAIQLVTRAGVAAASLLAQIQQQVGLSVGTHEQRALELEKKGSA